MGYLDKFTRLEADNFERELARVALIDSRAKLLTENQELVRLLSDIRSGSLTAPSDRFEPHVLQFLPDSKYSDWAVKLYYERDEQALFTAAAGLSNVLRLKNDTELASHCRLVGYVFPDGWPNDPDLYEATVSQEALQKAAPTEQAVNNWLAKVIHFLKMPWRK
jgi:hypothetical protein